MSSADLLPTPQNHTGLEALLGISPITPTSPIALERLELAGQPHFPQQDPLANPFC